MTAMSAGFLPSASMLVATIRPVPLVRRCAGKVRLRRTRDVPREPHHGLPRRLKPHSLQHHLDHHLGHPKPAPMHRCRQDRLAFPGQASAPRASRPRHRTGRAAWRGRAPVGVRRGPTADCGRPRIRRSDSFSTAAKISPCAAAYVPCGPGWGAEHATAGSAGRD